MHINTPYSQQVVIHPFSNPIRGTATDSVDTELDEVSYWRL